MKFNKRARIFVAGHHGMVGSSIIRTLHKHGFYNTLTADRDVYDLRDAAKTASFFECERPDFVFLAAAKVGGIRANKKYPADFLLDNLMIQNNIFKSSLKYAVQKLCFLGSSCIYPKECPQPMREEYLLTGLLEPTNEGYALAKIAGLKLAHYLEVQYGFKSVCPMPCNLYGPNDSFDPENSHVLSALVKKFVDAKKAGYKDVILWGSGVARREFLHVDDLSEALMVLMEQQNSSEPVNVGWGEDISIKDLANKIAEKVGFSGKIIWDLTESDGMPRKCLDVSKIKSFGFSPSIDLDHGISHMIALYENIIH